VVSATNRNLTERIQAQAFREDLYFRLAVIPIAVPPLRERPEDIPLLVEHFVARLAQETGGKPRKLAPAAVGLLQGYAFPGNVRELRNLVERLMIMTPGGSIGAEQVQAVLPRIESAAPGERRLSDAVQEFERRQIDAALQATGGSMTQAAARLGLERSHLYKKLRKLGIKPEGGST
jgi:two-component system nitrogen regulation response regulator NtrX